MKNSINVIDAVIDMATKLNTLKEKYAIMKKAFKIAQQNHLDALEKVNTLETENAQFKIRCTLNDIAIGQLADEIVALKKENDTLQVITDKNERVMRDRLDIIMRLEGQLQDESLRADSNLAGVNALNRKIAEDEEHLFTVIACLIDDGVDHLYHMRNDAETIFYARYQMWRIMNPGTPNYRDFYYAHWDDMQMEMTAMSSEDVTKLLHSTLDDLNRAKYPLRETTGIIPV